LDKAPAIGLMVVAGSFIALQAPINGMLGRTVGTFAAASVSFSIGTAALVAITVLVGGGFGDLGEARGLSWYYLAGGVLGALYVTSALATVRVLGAGGVTAATITGQLVTAVVLDRLGALGLEQRPLSAARLIGIVLLAVGTYLVVRE
jgi:bacterial/archaeal transporter family-2 protein